MLTIAVTSLLRLRIREKTGGMYFFFLSENYVRKFWYVVLGQSENRDVNQERGFDR